jgi:hypothetical protein
VDITVVRSNLELVDNFGRPMNLVQRPVSLRILRWILRFSFKGVDQETGRTEIEKPFKKLTIRDSTCY